MSHFQIATAVRIKGAMAPTIYKVDSLPAVDNGQVYVTLPDDTQGFWIDPAQLVAVHTNIHTKHPYTGGTVEDKAWHDQRTRELVAAEAQYYVED